jgi:transcriptional regulator with XRE-family HTH domain
MNAKDVIDTLLEQEHTTRYRLAKQLGVQQSLLSRAYNNKSDPGFNEVSTWLDKLGYTISITESPNKQLDNAQAFSLDEFGKMLASLDDCNYDYLLIHRHLKQLIESYGSNPRPVDATVLPSRIKNKGWRAFYAAAVSYLSKMVGNDTPARFDSKSNGSKQPWSPIKKLGKSHTKFDETFAKYNILLPEGELKWI